VASRWLWPILILLCLPLATVFAATTEEATVSAVTMSLQAYAPARIVISYAYTNSFTVGNVSSMGRSMYKIVSSPTGIEFEGVDVDRYTFTADVGYGTVTDQLIQVAVFSADHPPEGIQYNVRGKVVKVTVALTVEKEPKYPTAEEVAEAVVNQISTQLQDFRTQTERIVETQNRNVMMQWVLIGFNACVSFAFLIILLFQVYPQLSRIRREEDRTRKGKEKEGDAGA